MKVKFLPLLVIAAAGMSSLIHPTACRAQDADSATKWADRNWDFRLGYYHPTNSNEGSGWLRLGFDYTAWKSPDRSTSVFIFDRGNAGTAGSNENNANGGSNITDGLGEFGIGVQYRFINKQKPAASAVPFIRVGVGNMLKEQESVSSSISGPSTTSSIGAEVALGTSFSYRYFVDVFYTDAGSMNTVLTQSGTAGNQSFNGWGLELGTEL